VVVVDILKYTIGKVEQNRIAEHALMLLPSLMKSPRVSQAFIQQVTPHNRNLHCCRLH
jgi:hypothetical protein